MTPKMTAKEFAALLDGRQYLHEITKAEEALAQELGFLVVFGQSDDLAELRGVIRDEIGCFDGGDLEHPDLPETLRAIWCPDGGAYSWGYETKMPHASFKIFEEDELYCIGIVIDWNMVQAELYWCDQCCNFDREHTDCGGVALCKFMNLQTYSECYGKNCIGFNVPHSNIFIGRKGHWIPKSSLIRTPDANNYVCSECGLEHHYTKHCPECGAKMDGLAEREGKG